MKMLQHSKLGHSCLLQQQNCGIHLFGDGQSIKKQVLSLSFSIYFNAGEYQSKLSSVVDDF